MEAEEKSIIDEMLEKARKAQAVVETYSQEQVDALVKAIGKVIYDHAEELAKEAVDETHYGRVDSKTYKQQKACAAAWFYLRDKKSVGVIDNDTINGIVTFAKPAGIVACLTPSTNPTSTAASNGMNIIKCRNAMIISPHPGAKNVSVHGAELIRQALKEAGAPDDLVQIIEAPSMALSRELMAKADVTVATGGAAMVKSAYSSGRPSYGVGQGNVQVLVAEDFEDYDDMAVKIVNGRAYDNGIPCTGEQAIHFPGENYAKLIAAFEKAGAAVIPDEKVAELPGFIFKENGAINPVHVGMKPVKIADELGFEIPEDTQVLLFNTPGMNDENILRREKLLPVIQLFPYDDFRQAVADAKANLLWEGAGHTSVIYTNDTEKAEYAGAELPVGRLLVNQAGGAASGGNYINGLNPTMSIGCGSWGNNSISENLTYKHLMNTTRLAYYHECTMPPLDEVWKL
ncbi:MAG: aldehyde dehydrogenase family protein [Dorea sp.]|nr:aldehyde dehydrogenase family protein [Dorea sp.]